MITKNIRIADYSYDLPSDRIAKFPVEERDRSKLLVYKDGNITSDSFFNLPNYLTEHSLMIFNNAKVIQARLHFQKATGANIEIFLLEPYLPADYESVFQSTGGCSWLCLVGNLKKWKDDDLTAKITIQGEEYIIKASLSSRIGTSIVVRFEWTPSHMSFADILEAFGELPIPPYLHRNTEESYKTTYQTVYSKIKGSVAAPTAGLHFTETVLSELRNSNIEMAEVTLHVGAGTFRPVKSDSIGEHDMHSEAFSVPKNVIQKILDHNCEITAVGTTSVRTIESLYYLGSRLSANKSADPTAFHVNQWEPYENEWICSPQEALECILAWMDSNDQSVLNATTQIIIADGYKYHYVKRLITNFHQPQSTLLLLISAFVGERWKDIYKYALEHDYRFLSYGDSSLLIP